jgi:rhodanese-related sulfurtransferase
MGRILATAVKQAVIISIAVVVVGLTFNLVRHDGMPLVADADTFRVQTDAEFIKVDNAWQLFDEGKAIFVDARDPQVFSVEHIEGALNVPPAGPELQALGWLSDTESNVICYASEESQRQAGVVADKLLGMGTRRVFVLYGGMEAWKGAGLPVEKD